MLGHFDNLCLSFLQSSVQAVAMLNNSKRHVGGGPRFFSYLLCVMVVLETATAADSVRSAGTVNAVWSSTVKKPAVRRHAFSVTNDLVMLTKMLHDESQRRRLQRAEAFFAAALNKRNGPLSPKQAVAPRRNLRTSK